MKLSLITFLNRCYIYIYIYIYGRCSLKNNNIMIKKCNVAICNVALESFIASGILWASTLKQGWPRIRMKVGRFCGILGPMCAKNCLKCLFFRPWGFPREAQDEVFKGAIFKTLECLQTILFTTLEACQRSHGPGLRTGSVGLSRRVFLWSFEEVGC